MGQAIGQILPLAVGVAISPVPIIAVVLMLVTPQARVNVAMAAKQWRGRPRGAEEPPVPKWMGAIDESNAPKAFAVGALLSGLNPKNLLLAVAAAAAIAQTGISGGDEAVAYLVFALLAAVGVTLPVAISFAMGEQAAALLHRLNGWMAHNNAVIMSVLLLVIGAKLVGDAISGFAA
jgi:threonine/homoserine/homoserine lactone efflux protein